MTQQNEVIMTIQQVNKLESLKDRWPQLGQPQSTIGCDGAIAVQAYPNGMWLCVETDGYCHS